MYQNCGVHQCYLKCVFPVTTKHLYIICTMLDERWADVVQMLYKYFVFVSYLWLIMLIVIYL